MAVTKPKRRMRKVTRIGREARRDPKLDAVAQSMFDQAEAMLLTASSLDTAVRDSVSEGLAFLVHAAFDTRAIAECVSEFDMGPYIQQNTYQWFRDRGFVEWFCAGASTLFKTSPRCFYRMKFRKASGKDPKATIISREKVG